MKIKLTSTFKYLVLSSLIILNACIQSPEFKVDDCEIHLLDSEQSLPEPQFVYTTDDDGETVAYDYIAVFEQDSDEALWEAISAPFSSIQANKEFFYGEELNGLEVKVEPVALAVNKKYSITIESFLCESTLNFSVDGDGRVSEEDL